MIGELVEPIARKTYNPGGGSCTRFFTLILPRRANLIFSYEQLNNGYVRDAGTLSGTNGRRNEETDTVSDGNCRSCSQTDQLPQGMKLQSWSIYTRCVYRERSEGNEAKRKKEKAKCGVYRNEPMTKSDQSE